MGELKLTLTFGDDGVAQVVARVPNLGAVATLSIGEARGRAFVTSVLVESPDGVSADTLRAIPLGRIEAVLNSRELLPNSAIGAELGNAQLDQSGVFRVTEPVEITVNAKPRLRLKVPPGRGRKPDNFYRMVAAVFGDAAGSSTRPAQAVADANHVPVTTVHGWVKEARRRGILPPGERRPREQRKGAR